MKSKVTFFKFQWVLKTKRLIVFNSDDDDDDDNNNHDDDNHFMECFHMRYRRPCWYKKQ